MNVDPPMNADPPGRLTRAPAVLLALGLALSPWPAFAAPDGSDTAWDGSEPPQGVYFYWYEPSFYAGFAPRTQDPQRIHIRLSRGNQVRATVVLGDPEIDAYLGDLVLRQKTYQELIDAAQHLLGAQMGKGAIGRKRIVGILGHHLRAPAAA